MRLSPERIGQLARSGELKGYRHVSPRRSSTGNRWRFLATDVADAFGISVAELEELWLARGGV